MATFMEESPLTLAGIPVWPKPVFPISANIPVKEERVQIRPKGTGEFVDPHINHYKKLVLMAE